MSKDKLLGPITDVGKGAYFRGEDLAIIKEALGCMGVLLENARNANKSRVGWPMAELVQSDALKRIELRTKK
jgi:hypothetical protein